MKWPKGLRKRKRPRGPKSSSPCLCLLECKLQHPRAALLRGTAMSIDTNGSEGLLGQLLARICLEHCFLPAPACATSTALLFRTTSQHSHIHQDFMAVANTSCTPSTFRHRTDPGTALWVDLCFGRQPIVSPGESDCSYIWELW